MSCFCERSIEVQSIRNCILNFKAERGMLLIAMILTSTPPKTVRGPLPKMAYFRTAGMFSYRVCTKLTGWLRVKVRAPVP